MLNAIILALAVVVPIQQTDTTFAVAPGTRIEIENNAGDVVVRTWDRSEVRVVAEHSDREEVVIRVAGSVARIGTRARYGISRAVEYQVTVPRNSAIRVRGQHTDVTVVDAGSDVDVQILRGDIRVGGGNGRIALRSVQGAVSLRNASGSVRVNTVNDDIRLRTVEGDILIDAVNGDIVLEDIRSESVEAGTVNGDISFDGAIRDAGRYILVTHNGDISFRLPESTNATLTLVTLNGEVDASFPIVLTDLGRGKRFTALVGSGSARIDLESFNGTIHLRRPLTALKARE